jgi:uncharacterized DUF497 family protein
MRFDWDEGKNRANLREHGLPFAEAPEMFRGPLLVRPDMREDYGEERWLGIGMTSGRVVFVAFAKDSVGTIRIISLRKANHEESKEYEQALQNGLEAD